MQFLKKSLGQNFLIDKNVIKIINSVQIKNKNIIEIGPGKGSSYKRNIEERSQIFFIN